MPKVKDELLHGTPTGRIYFNCPGCGDTHVLNVKQGSRPCWEFNGDYEKPTFTPSVLYKSGHYMDGNTEHCWCRWAEKHPGEEAPFKCCICHSFVTDGKIRYLGDCSHELAGQTIDLPDIEG